MALWEKAQRLQGSSLEQLRSIYNQYFPIDVRHYCAEYIEQQPWSSVDIFNQNHEKMAQSMLKSLIREIEVKAGTVEFLTRVKLNDATNQLRDAYSQNALGFVQIVRQMLETEKQLVQHAEDPSGPAPKVSNIFTGLPVDLTTQFESIQRRTAETEEDLKRLREAQESFVIVYHEKYQIDDAITKNPDPPTLQKLKQKKEAVDNSLNQKANEILTMRSNLASKMFACITELEKVQGCILNDHLMNWRRQQQLSGNGVAFYNNLDQIQQLCEMLAEYIWLNRQQLQLVTQLRTQLPIPMDTAQDLHPMLTQKITDLLSTLVTSTFIVERQAPQVMKVSNKFTCSVRLLVGSKLNVHMTNPQVVGTIISEQQARQLIQGDKTATAQTAGVIVNNSGRMEYNQATRQLVVNFRNMALKTVKRSEKRKHQEAVTEEKFCLLFQSKFTVANELAFSVWTLSLPVVVIVHGSQEAQATAVIMWDNAFAPSGRMPFDVPKEVTWLQLAEQLNYKFKSMVGAGLQEEHLYFLASKLFGPADNYNTLRVSRNKFHKENLPERKFTFWEWFYDAMKLTKDHLQELWNNGLVHGFLSKQTTQEMLLSKQIGTFLLRFSDSILGGITIAWLNSNEETHLPEVLSIQPYTHKDFAIRSCADRILDLGQNLQYLYPDIPRDQAFEKFYGTSPSEAVKPTTNSDYVPSILVTTTTGIGGGAGSVGPNANNAGNMTPSIIPVGAANGSVSRRSTTPFATPRRAGDQSSPQSPTLSSQDTDTNLGSVRTPRAGVGHNDEDSSPPSESDLGGSSGHGTGSSGEVDEAVIQQWLADDDMNDNFTAAESAPITENDLYNILNYGRQ